MVVNGGGEMSPPPRKHFAGGLGILRGEKGVGGSGEKVSENIGNLVSGD